jgi:DNA-binding transcriptional LysR family regulator
VRVTQPTVSARSPCSTEDGRGAARAGPHGHHGNSAGEAPPLGGCSSGPAGRRAARPAEAGPAASRRHARHRGHVGVPPAVALWHRPGPTRRVDEPVRRRYLERAVIDGAVDLVGVPDSSFAGGRAHRLGALRHHRAAGAAVLARPHGPLTAWPTTLGHARRVHGCTSTCDRSAPMPVQPRSAVQTRQVDTAIQLAAAGQGVTVAPVNAVHPTCSGPAWCRPPLLRVELSAFAPRRPRVSSL